MKKYLLISLFLAFGIVGTASAASTLWEHFKGRLPSIDERSIVAVEAGIVQKRSEYRGTAEQNTALLHYFEKGAADTAGSSFSPGVQILPIDSSRATTSTFVVGAANPIISLADGDVYINGNVVLAASTTVAKTVGVATSTPSETFSVHGGALIAGTTTVKALNATSSLAVGGTTGSNFIVQSTGNVGIGTTNPLVELHMVESGNSAIRFRFDSTATDWELNYNSQLAGGIGFRDITNGRNVLFMTNGGNVGAGTTSPTSLLSVHGESLLAGTTTTGALRATSTVIFDNLPTNSGVINQVCIDTKGSLSQEANCTLSSMRYKHDIFDQESALSTVMALRPRRFKYNNDDTGQERFGFIAEEVDQVDKRFVNYNKEGLPNSVRYEEMVSLLVKFGQEQQEKIEQLEARIKTLESGRNY